MIKKYQYKTGDIYQSDDGILMFIIMSSLHNNNIIDGNKYCFQTMSFDLGDHLFYEYLINIKDIKLND